MTLTSFCTRPWVFSLQLTWLSSHHCTFLLTWLICFSSSSFRSCVKYQAFGIVFPLKRTTSQACFSTTPCFWVVFYLKVAVFKIYFILYDQSIRFYRWDPYSGLSVKTSWNLTSYRHVSLLLFEPDCASLHRVLFSYR